MLKENNLTSTTASLIAGIQLKCSGRVAGPHLRVCGRGAGGVASCCTPQCIHTEARLLLQVPLDTGKDMYEKQFEAFLRAVRTGDKSGVRCHFGDASRTYQASWWITEAGGSPSPDGSVPDG